MQGEVCLDRDYGVNCMVYLIVNYCFIAYEPKAGALVPALRKYPQLHDPEYVVKHRGMPADKSPLVLP